MFRGRSVVCDVFCFFVVFWCPENRCVFFLNNSEMSGLEVLFRREVAGLHEQGYNHGLPFVEVEKGA